MKFPLKISLMNDDLLITLIEYQNYEIKGNIIFIRGLKIPKYQYNANKIKINMKNLNIVSQSGNKILNETFIVDYNERELNSNIIITSLMNIANRINLILKEKQ